MADIIEPEEVVRRLSEMNDRELSALLAGAKFSGRSDLKRQEMVEALRQSLSVADDPATAFARTVFDSGLHPKTASRLLGHVESRDKLQREVGKSVAKGLRSARVFRDMKVEGVQADLVFYSREIGSYGSLVPALDLRHTVVLGFIVYGDDVASALERARTLDGSADKIFLSGTPYSLLAYLVTNSMATQTFLDQLTASGFGLVVADFAAKQKIRQLLAAETRAFQPQRYMSLVEQCSRSKPFL